MMRHDFPVYNRLGVRYFSLSIVTLD
jgi:hypothetical protein